MNLNEITELCHECSLPFSVDIHPAICISCNHKFHMICLKKKDGVYKCDKCGI